MISLCRPFLEIETMTQTEPRIEISEQDGIFHWTIYRPDGTEFNHSAYHTDRAVCEAEAKERLAQYVNEGWL